MKLEKTRDEWNKIESAVSAADHSCGLYHFSMSAWQNAGETEGVKFDTDEFYVVCFDSLGSLLSYSDDTYAHDFFEKLGVRF